MIEVEVKLKIDDHAAVKKYLQDGGFERVSFLTETDTYYDNEAGRIRKGDSALRIRRTEDLLAGGTVSVVTFKGPKMDSRSMTRQEEETAIEDADVFDAILRALGYEPVEPRVIKQREQYNRNDLHACLDRVEGLGDFLELEIMAEESGYETALETIERQLQALGYSMEDTTRISYLSQLQEKFKSENRE